MPSKIKIQSIRAVLDSLLDNKTEFKAFVDATKGRKAADAIPLHLRQKVVPPEDVEGHRYLTKLLRDKVDISTDHNIRSLQTFLNDVELAAKKGTQFAPDDVKKLRDILQEQQFMRKQSVGTISKDGILNEAKLQNLSDDIVEQMIPKGSMAPDTRKGVEWTEEMYKYKPSKPTPELPKEGKAFSVTKEKFVPYDEYTKPDPSSLSDIIEGMR